MVKHYSEVKIFPILSSFIIGLGFSLGVSLFIIKSFSPDNAKAAFTLTSASAALSNPRLSYRAQPTVGAINTSTVTITGSGQPDNNTNHLFPNDTVCFTNGSDPTGCIGNKNYTVASIVDGTNFNVSSPLTAAISTTGFAVATQSGTLTLTFTTVSQVPIGGNIYLSIPASRSTNNTNDGIPDVGSAITNNGFDLNGLAVGGITVTGCTDGNWNTAGATITAGNGSTTDHTILIPRVTTACAASTAITVTITGLVNPSPITSGHTQGTADNYKISITTRDTGNNALDSSIIAVAPVEGVLVSATVDETLSFAVLGISSTSGTLCGVSRTGSSLATTATTVPWGTISSANTFYDAVQKIVVSTNASAGYTVKVEANDQMGENGSACTGAGSESSTPPCIKDTACGATPCTTSQARNWSTAAGYSGLGLTLENTNGSGDAVWTYANDGAGCSAQTYCARPLPDVEASASKMTIMTKATPVSGSSAFVCYRITVSATQPAGYYFNKVKYTAAATF